jgi:hypothetical protein
MAKTVSGVLPVRMVERAPVGAHHLHVVRVRVQHEGVEKP